MRPPVGDLEKTGVVERGLEVGGHLIEMENGKAALGRGTGDAGRGWRQRGTGAVSCQRGTEGASKIHSPHPRLPGADGGQPWGRWCQIQAAPGVRGKETLLGEAHCIPTLGRGLSHLPQPGQARLECLGAIKPPDATTGTTHSTTRESVCRNKRPHTMQ